MIDQHEHWAELIEESHQLRAHLYLTHQRDTSLGSDLRAIHRACHPEGVRLVSLGDGLSDESDQAEPETIGPAGPRPESSG